MPLFCPFVCARRLGAIAVLFAAFILSVQSAQAQQSTPEAGVNAFDPSERQEIRRLVREYLLENPEIIMEAVQILREREQQARANSRAEALAENRAALNDPGPLEVFGNPNGDVTVVEFFDYRCPYCRSIVQPLMETIEADGNVRLVMKEYPILGQDSVFAARAAIAASMQDRYKDFHVAMMTDLQEVTQDGVLKLAERMDLDTDQLQKNMQSETVDKELQRTFKLAEALQVGGTPAFVIGDTITPGAVDMERLKELIAEARATQD